MCIRDSTCIYGRNFCHEYDACIFLYLCDWKSVVDQRCVNRTVDRTNSGKSFGRTDDTKMGKEKSIYIWLGYDLSLIHI